MNQERRDGVNFVDQIPDAVVGTFIACSGTEAGMVGRYHQLSCHSVYVIWYCLPKCIGFCLPTEIYSLTYTEILETVSHSTKMCMFSGIKVDH